MLRSAAVFLEGSLVAGKFRIDRLLGKGGMGVVMAATHIHLNQRVALKVLRPDDAKNPHVLERFVREARAAAALRGEHVCRVSDVGALDDGTPYIVMELLEGTDLSRMLHTSGPLPVQRACSYVLQACVGVSEAHSLGIVHRDLKPANLFVAHRPDGTTVVKVLDFGIAKAATDDNGDFSLTRTSAVLGSPGYMSPEQLRSSRDVDLRTDIWSIGVILYELITGKRPFNAQTITELAIRVTVDPRPPFVAPMPHGFDHVIDRCLAKEPRDRYPDLANLAHALAAYAGPDGWELANAVSRMLRATPLPKPGPRLIAGDPAAVPQTGFAPPTIAPTAYGVPSKVPYPSVEHAPPVQTTLGSSAVSFDATPTKPRRRGLIAGIAAVTISSAAFVIALVTRGGGGGELEPPRPIVIPAQAPPDAEATPPPPPDAEVAIVAPDAEVVNVPVDAAPVAVPEDAPVKKKVIIKKKRDFGEKRQ